MNLRETLRGRWWGILLLLLFLALIVETAHFGWKAINVEGPPRAALSLAVSGAGSVNPGAGTHHFAKDTLVIVEAEPEEGWVFSHWVGPVADEKSPRTTLTLDGDVELEAVFVEEDLGLYAYTLDIRGEGSVFPAAGRHEFLPADEGTRIPVKAEPAPGHAFDRWTLNGSEVGRDPVYQFSLTDGAVLTAHFKPLYAVTVDYTKGGIARGPSGLLEKGDQVKVEAISSPGYGFKEWIENGRVVSENPVHIFKVEGGHHLTARFVPVYKLNVLATEGGKAFASHDEALEGTEVKVAAVADPGYAFVGWSEGGKRLATGIDIDLGFAFISIPLSHINTTEYSFTLDRNRTLVAEFVEAYPVEVSVAGNVGGSVKAPAGPALKGRKSVIIAVPDEGYLFDRWTEGDKEYYGEVFTFWGDRHLKLTAHFIPGIRIEAGAEPGDGGTVRGAGTYKEGAEVVLKALPAANHTFEGWYENGEKVCADPEYSFTAAGDRRLAARFEPYLEIAARAIPAEGGRVRGAGFYQKGSEVVLTAVPNPGYEFDHWLMDGEQVPGAPARYSFTAGESHLFEAVFRKVNEYTVNISSSLPGAGFVSGGGTFNEGTRVTVFAIPKVNYRFVGWTENGEVVSSDLSYSFTLDQDRNLIANFVELHYLGLEAEPKVGGWFEGRGYHGAGSVVNVKAIPSYGYRFDRWTEGGMELGHGSSFDLTIERNYALVAHFVKAHQVTIRLGEFDGGSVSGEGVHDVGATVTVRAEPYEGYVFSIWTRNGVKVSEELEYSFTMPDEPVELVAHFLPLHDIYVAASPEAGGTVSISGESPYVHGDRITVEAAANDGYEFYCWKIGDDVVSYSLTYTFYADKSCTLTAVFRALRKVTLEAVPPEGAADLYASWKYPGNQEHPEGESITITAIPAAGYFFDRWTIGSADGETLLDEEGQPAGRVHTFTVGDTDLHLVAHFEEIPSYQITVEASPPEWGTVSGGDLYVEGTTATVIATPNPGYYFSRWTEGGQQVSTSATYSFTVTGPRHLVAHFVAPVTVRAYSNPSSRGQVSIQHPGGTTSQGADVSVQVAPGSSVTLRSHTGSGSTFDGWYEGGSRVSTSTNYTVNNVTTNRTFEARFSESKGTSCPFVYSFNETGYHLENEAISQFRSKALENTYYGTLRSLREVDGKYHVQIAEKLQEKSFINWFKLVAVDYPADRGITGVVADINGRPHTIKERIKPISFTDDSGRSWLEEVSTEGLLIRSDYGDYREGKPVVAYEAEFARPSGALSEAKLMITLKADKISSICWDWFMDDVDGRNNQWWIDEILNRAPFKNQFISFTDIVALRVELWNGSEWLLQGMVRPGDLLQEFLVPIDLKAVASTEETIKVRLRGGSGFFVLDTVSIDFSENEIARVIELEPEAALFNGEKDVREELSSKNSDERIRLLPEEWIDLFYNAPELADNHERGFMSFLHGYYHAHPEAVENPATNYWNELSAAEIAARVIETIPGAVKIIPRLFRMYRLMTSVADLPLEEKVNTIIVDHVLPWIEAKGLLE